MTATPSDAVFRVRGTPATVHINRRNLGQTTVVLSRPGRQSFLHEALVAAKIEATGPAEAFVAARSGRVPCWNNSRSVRRLRKGSTF